MGNVILTKTIRIFAAIIYLFSEIEAEIQRPGNYTPFRYFYLKLIKVNFGTKCYFSRGIVIYNGNQISIGKYASIGERSMLHAHGRIIIGDYFLSAPGLTINSGGHHISDLTPFDKKIIIGDRVWCGTNVTILAGVEIGHDVIIGACSLVTKNIPSNSVVAGSPAKIIRTISRIDQKVWTWHQDK